MPQKEQENTEDLPDRVLRLKENLRQKGYSEEEIERFIKNLA